VDGLDPRERRLQQTIARSPPDGLVSRTDVEQLCFCRISNPKDIAEVFGDSAEFFFAGCQRFLRAFALRDIGDKPEDCTNVAAIVA